MPKLEIQSPDGQTELRRLSRRSPIVVGRNPISDVCIDEESVAPIHCRISWNGNAFEVTAVTDGGVDVNGVLVRQKELGKGDVIAVGDYLLAYRRSRDLLAATPTVADHSARPAEKVRRRTSERTTEPVHADDAGLNDDDLAALASESDGGIGGSEATPRSSSATTTRPRSRSRRDRATEDERRRSESPENGSPEEEPVLLDQIPSPPAVEPGKQEPEKTDSDTAKPAAAKASSSPSRFERLRYTKRPGDQDILTSPLVLGFGGLSLILLLAAGTFWLLIDREAANRLYTAAVADREAGRYAQAISGFDQFLIEFPTDERSRDARFALGLTRIERYAGGASPDFEQALAAFDEFVRGHRDLDGFDEQRDSLRRLAQQMTSGAAAAAIRTGDRKSLNAAEQARQLFDRYAPQGSELGDVRRALTNELASATAAVRKQEYFERAAATIDAAIEESDFTTAFATRADLLTRYPELAGDRRVRSLLDKSLKAEQALVQPVEPAATPRPPDEAAGNMPVLTLVGHSQARAGEVSDGRLVFAVARGSLFGLDAVTGRPRWRAAIGLDTPFFPVAVEASVPALVVFDATRKELVLLNQEDGTAIWRTAIDASVVGPPLIAQGQVDLVTDDGRLVRWALDTGEAVAAVSFPQPIVGPPVLTGGGERLIVFGDRATAYTLDLRSLEVQAVSFTGQAEGAIDVPPQTLGNLVLVCENDRLDAAVVRAFSLDAGTNTLKQVASERIDGPIRQVPVARGNVLFVPSSPEQITPISVSDDAGQPPLTPLNGIRIPEGQDVPTFLVPGPDGMLWAAGSALRKLRLVAKKLELLRGSLAPGRHTQPPQSSGGSLFVARSLPSAQAVYVSQADRESMTGSWRTVLGAAPVAVSHRDGAATVVNEAGQTAIASSDKIAEGGFFETRMLPQWSEESSDPLHGASLDDGRAVAWRGGAASQLWLIAAGGAAGQPRSLPAEPQCPPAALDGGIVLPVPGRLEWLPDRAGAGKVEAFLLAIGDDNDEAPRWLSVARIDGEQLAAVDGNGILRVIRLRQEPLPHLAEVASLKLDKPPSQPLAVAAGKIAVAIDDRVLLLDPAGLRTVAEATADDPIVGGPWSGDSVVFVQNGQQALLAFGAADLEKRWQATLDAPVAGRPLQTADGWSVATQAGTVATFGDDGAEREPAFLGAPLTGLFSLGDTTVAACLDGSLTMITPAVPSVAPDEPQPAAEAQAATETAETGS